jgi:hypothetical protein
MGRLSSSINSSGNAFLVENRQQSLEDSTLQGCIGVWEFCIEKGWVVLLVILMNWTVSYDFQLSMQ